MRLRLSLRASILLLVTGLSVGAFSFTFTHFAGSFGGPGFDDATSNEARFHEPSGIATDGTNVYVADRHNQTVRHISPAGVVTTLAGFAELAGSDNGHGGHARFRNPAGLAVGPGGSVYVADQGNHTIRLIASDAVVTTVAGSAGEPGLVDGTTGAKFQSPAGITVDGSGTLYVADTGNHAIRKISGGVVTTLAGTGSPGNANGVGIAASFENPTGIVFDASTNSLFVADSGNAVIRQITLPGAVVTTFAGTMDVQGHVNGLPGKFFSPHSLTMAGGGALYVSDSVDHSIRHVSASGSLSDVAGFPMYPGPDDGSGLAARFQRPRGVALKGTTLYVGDSGNHTVRAIDTATGNLVSTFAGLANASGFVNGAGSTARFASPSAVFHYPGPGYGWTLVLDSQNNAVRRVTWDGIVSTLAGGSFGYAEGTGTAAQFRSPLGMAGWYDGTVYIADTGNHCIRLVTSTGGTSLFAGQPGSLGNVNGDRLSAAKFFSPRALARSGPPNPALYVHDAGNFTIRKIDLTTGLVSTVMSVGSYYDSSSLSIGLSAPDSNLYLSGGGYVGLRTSDETTTVLAGSSSIGPQDGIGTAAAFGYPGPRAISVWSPYGYILDSLANQVRRIDLATNEVTTIAGAPTPPAPPYADRLNAGTSPGTGPFARFNKPTALSSSWSELAIVEGNTLRIGKAEIADRATIDVAAAPAGEARQLDAQPVNADSWEWSVIRRPTGSVATFSSATIRNPTFTPDVADIYVFRCVAKKSASDSLSISTVVLDASLAPFGPPSGLVATAASASQVNGSWLPVFGATSYEIHRSFNNSAFTLRTTTASTSFADTGLAAHTTYLYKVRAIGAGGPSGFSPVDPATTIVFTDDPLGSGTVAKSVHVTQLRSAVNAMRAAAGLAPVSFTDTAAAGTPIRALHLTQLRNGLQEARGDLALPVIMWTDSTLTAGNTAIKAVHIQQVRDGVK